METKETPLILVSYMDRELTTNKILMQIINDNMNDIIAAKGANIISLIIPTDGEERMECINPVLLDEAGMERVNKLVDEIALRFDIGQGADEGKND